jgi:general stress protein YciG
MTLQSPRIYLYKITFEEVPYYYYGIHKEKAFGEEYWGSPKTNKWCWELYTPKKQILEIFDFTDDGWMEAQEVEKRIIKPVFNTDKWCLNENVGGYFSLETLRKSGRIMGLKNKENFTGFCGRTLEKMSEDGRKGGLKVKENGTGIFAQTPEELRELGRRNGLKNKENGTGIFSITPEQRREIGRKSGLKNKENGIGIFAQTSEQRSEHSRKIGLKNKENGTGFYNRTAEQHSENSKKGGKNASLQKWLCLETGFVTNAGNLTKYQRKRGIDTSKRKRIL